jgi:hypothetical protein
LDGSGSFPKDERIAVNGDALDQMGPVDYILVEWPGRQPNGEIAPHLVDLVDRGLIRIIDLTFITKDEDGTVAGLELADLGGEVAELAIFEGASSGLIHDDDVAAAVRRSGGELVASGRVPVEDLLAALDAAEATA